MNEDRDGGSQVRIRLAAGAKEIRTRGPTAIASSVSGPCWSISSRARATHSRDGCGVRTTLVPESNRRSPCRPAPELPTGPDPISTHGHRLVRQQLAEAARLGTSRVDRAANGLCRSCSSGYGTEVGLFLENRTTAAANVRTGFDCLARPQADQAASSRVHSASLVQPWRIMYWASSADISMVPSGLTLMCRPEKVCTDPIPEGACRRTRYRSGFSGF
jgi:hypothetical protein